MNLLILSSLLCLAFAKIQDEAEIDKAVALEIALQVAEEENAGAFLVKEDIKGCGPCQRRHHSHHQHQKPCEDSSSSASTEDCCEECPKVFFDYLDFYTNYPVFDNVTPAVGTWSYWSTPEVNPTYVADQGVLTTGCNGGVLRSVYTAADAQLPAENPTADHAKFWVYAQTPVPVPNHGDVVVKYEASVQTFKTEDNPFPSVVVERNDYRMATGRFTVFDPETRFEFSFMLTNSRVYILYQRGPRYEINKAGLQPNTGDAAFTFVIPVKIRKACDYHDMTIVLHGETRSVSWILDNRTVYQLNKVGYLIERDYLVNDLGGVEALDFPQQVFYGFGSFSALDWYPACQRSKSCDACRYPFIREALVDLTDATGFTQWNPIFGPDQTAVFWDPVGTNLANHAWDQGTVTKIKKLIAYQKLNVC